MNNYIICKDSLTCEKCEEGYNNTNPYICETNKLKEEKKLISHCKINDILSNNCELDYKEIILILKMKLFLESKKI